MGRLLDERMPQRILGWNALIRVEVHHTLQEIRQLRHFAAIAFCIGQQCRNVLLDARVADKSPCLQSIIWRTLSNLHKLEVGPLPAKNGLSDDEVQPQEVQSRRQRHDSLFTSDNRTGLAGTLHRISAIRARDASICDLMCRIGRHIPGASLSRQISSS